METNFRVAINNSLMYNIFYMTATSQLYNEIKIILKSVKSIVVILAKVYEGHQGVDLTDTYTL